MTAMTADVVCLGETMALIAPDPPRPLATAERLVLGSAGAESNVAVGLARLGTPAQWCSRVGDDPLGRRVLADVAAAGVGTDLVRISANARTGLMLKDPQPGTTGVLYFRDNSAASQMDETDVDRALAAGPAVLHLSGITPALSPSCARAVEHALERAGPAGVVVSFDVNLRPALWPDPGSAAERLRALAQRCDIVFVGLDEAAALWSAGTADDVRSLLDRPDVLVVKDGGRSATSFDADGRHEVAALPLEVLEPVGAGDAFAAGWLHAHRRGSTAETKLRLGHLVAAGSLLAPGDLAVTPVATETLEAAAKAAALWPPDRWPPEEVR